MHAIGAELKVDAGEPGGPANSAATSCSRAWEDIVLGDPR